MKLNDNDRIQALEYIVRETLFFACTTYQSAYKKLQAQLTQERVSLEACHKRLDEAVALLKALHDLRYDSLLETEESYNLVATDEVFLCEETRKEIKIHEKIDDFLKGLGEG